CQGRHQATPHVCDLRQHAARRRVYADAGRGMGAHSRADHGTAYLGRRTPAAAVLAGVRQALRREPDRGHVLRLRFFRTGPMSDGSAKKVQTSVKNSAMVSRIPICEVPRWLESARLPKAVTVVSALNKTARAVPDCRGSARPARQFMTK